MENIQESPTIDESNNFNQSGYSEQSSNSSILNIFDSHNNISFIHDKDSNRVVIGQWDKIIELQNAEKYLDKKLSTTTKVLKPLFLQYISLQRHTLRRHLKTCRNMIKDLGALVGSLNEETFPPKSLIQDELLLWTQELDDTYDRILELKAYLLQAMARADSSDFSMIRNTPLFATNLKSTPSILHSNFELTYKYISDVHKMQKSATTRMEDTIKQHEVISRLISKIMDVLPTASQVIINLGTENTDNVDNHLDISLNRSTVANQSTSTSNLFDEENLPSQQSDRENI